MISRSTATAPRIALIDAARGVALIAMTIFHLCWDLEMFGLVGRGFMGSPGMILAARIIAGSFLFLVGFSLVLAHGEHFRARAFLLRLAQISAAAALITLATRFATPEVFIFFGILHAIALGSVLGLVFLRAPWWVTALAALAVLTLRETLRTPALDGPMWWWTGLSQIVPLTNDWVPVFPFFGMILAGMAAAALSRKRGWLAAIAAPRCDGPAGRLLRFIGRHSLAYYLLHQPVMLAILYAGLWLSGNI